METVTSAPVAQLEMLHPSYRGSALDNFANWKNKMLLPVTLQYQQSSLVNNRYKL